MTARALQRGWNGPQVTGEKCLHIYVAADGTQTGYFKGRVKGVGKSIKLDGDTKTEWNDECSILRGDKQAAARRSGDKRTTLQDFALGKFETKLRSRVGHTNKSKRRSRRGVDEDMRVIRQHIVSTWLGRMAIGKIEVSHINEWIEELYTLRMPNGEKYAEGTLGGWVRILGGIFAEAKRAGLCTGNPVRELERGERPDRTNKKSSKRYLTTEQVDELLGELGEVFYPIIFLCAWTGLRISEVLGLTWNNFDLAAGTMTIELQWDGRERVETKTENSKATVPLMPEVLTRMREHRRTMAARGMQLVQRDKLAFVTLTGGPQHRRNVLRALQNAADRLGMNTDANGEPIKKVDLHSLRHSLISNGIDAGIPLPKMALVARNTVKTMVASYVNVAEEERKGVAVELANALGR